MNKGLKNYTKQFTCKVGNVNANVNLFKTDANMHIELPLISTTGLKTFGTSLVYNYQDREETGIFGKGFKLNYYAKITENGSKITVKNSDGSTDVYDLETWNVETQMMAKRIYEGVYNLTSHIELNDRAGNKIIYGAISEYPSKIVMKSGN